MPSKPNNPPPGSRANCCDEHRYDVDHRPDEDGKIKQDYIGKTAGQGRGTKNRSATGECHNQRNCREDRGGVSLRAVLRRHWPNGNLTFLPNFPNRINNLRTQPPRGPFPGRYPQSAVHSPFKENPSCLAPPPTHKSTPTSSTRSCPPARARRKENAKSA